jgi:hypothetical protein
MAAPSSKTGFAGRKDSSISSGQDRDGDIEGRDSRNRITAAGAENITSIDPAGDRSGEPPHYVREHPPLQAFLDEN